MTTRDDQVFERALDNAKSIDNAFPNQLIEALDLNAMIGFDNNTKSKIRELMAAANGQMQFPFKVTERAKLCASEANHLLANGLVAAVDGTNATNQFSLMSTDAYACAVGYVTSRTRGNPHVSIVPTSTRYTEGPILNIEDLAELCDALDEMRTQESWPTTFREYQERALAMRCEQEYVFIDGPIFTQNLLSQRRGMALYNKLTAMDDKHFIGVIKDISGSWTLSKWCGYSLEPDEGFMLGSLKTRFLDRFRNPSESVHEWLSQDMPDDYVRVVFKPGQKAFAFECRFDDFDIAIALLVADLSKTINHELPLLLETIDSHLRGGFDGNAATVSVLGHLQVQDQAASIDVINERKFR
jgi:hypothetical protein